MRDAHPAHHIGTPGGPARVCGDQRHAGGDRLGQPAAGVSMVVERYEPRRGDRLRAGAHQHHARAERHLRRAGHNAFGTALSSNATLSVSLLSPYITVQPADRSVTVGGSATFSVTAIGSPVLYYQ